MKTNYLLVLFAIGLAMTRLIPHPPNFTPIIAFAIISPVLFNNKIFGSVIVVLSMIISDIVIGFHQYQIVVYVSLLFISLLVPMNNNYKTLALSAFIASVWFFLVTNLAVWVAWDYYPKTFDGLIICYTAAIPFFQNTLLSTIFFTGLLIFLVKYIDIVKEKIFNMFVLESKL